MVEQRVRMADLTGQYPIKNFEATVRRLGFEKESMGAFEWAMILVEALGFSWSEFSYSVDSNRCVISQEQKGRKGKWGTWRWQLEISEDGHSFQVNSVPFSFISERDGFSPHQEAHLQSQREKV